MLRCDIHDETDSKFGRRYAGISAASVSWKSWSVTRVLVGFAFCASPWLGATTVDTQPPSTPDGLTASALTATSFTLGWRASTDNVKVTGYEVFLDGKALSPTTALSRTVECLEPASCHRLAVRARDARGNWSPCSAEFSVTTLADTTPPSVPAELRADSIKLKGFTLSWNAAEDDVKTTAYEVFRDGISLGTASGRSRNISGLAVGTSYSMTVRARDAAGNWSAQSAPLVVRSLADTTAPSVPEEACVHAVTATHVVLKWSPSKDDVKVVAYEVSRDGVSLGSAAGTSRRVANLSPLTTYVFRVRASDEAGNWSAWSAPISAKTMADTKKPSAPSALVASAVSASGFVLSWAASSDNVGVTAYEVLREGASVGTSSTPSLALGGLLPSTTYSVRVRARDAAGNWSALSPVLKVKTSGGEASPPSPPVALTSSAVTSTGFVLSWSAAASGASPVEYELFLNGISAGIVSGQTKSFVNLSPGATYRVAVRSRDSAGRWSSLSAELVVELAGAAFLGGFEADEGYQLGDLRTQNGWVVTGRAEVVASPVFAGRQALSVPPSSTVSFATHAYPDSATEPTFIDFFALPASASIPESGVFFETGAAAISLTKEMGLGRLYVFDGDGHGGGSWISTVASANLSDTDSVAEWMRLTLRLDPVAKIWDLYFNGRLVAADLGFVDNAVSAGALTLAGNQARATGFDDLFISGDNPIATDADRDGMDDAWEIAHGLNPSVNDRHADLDGDGIDNIHESLLGTDPSRADTDGDGIPDGWELANGLDPRLAGDAQRDDDNDGLTNRQEFLAGSNPNDFYNGRGFYLGAATPRNEIAYSYDPSGRLTSARYPSGRSIHYVHDGAGNLLSVTMTGRSPIVDWYAAHGLPADGAGLGSDAAVLASDGIPNLAKYAFGLDPRATVIGDFPAIARASFEGHRYLALTYQRPEPAPPDVAYTVEVSSDGSTWNFAAGSSVQVNARTSGSVTLVTARDATPCDSLPLTRRIRLKIERKISP